jgi:serine-type D-Ala-D-Ala carboxypeptidase (penicillin-binding protein 5/6)
MTLAASSLSPLARRFTALTLAVILCAACTAGKTTLPPASEPQAAIEPAAPQASYLTEAGTLSLNVAVEAPPVPPAPVGPLPLAWSEAPRPKLAALPAVPAVSAVAAVLIDEASGAVLFDKNAHMPLPPASLTKIATLILALESGRLDEWVDVDVDSTAMPGSTIMGLLPGDRFTLRDLLYGLMLPSGNDAALAIGRYLAGSDEAFVTAMNRLTQRLGLTESNFLNPHGLGGGAHATSAYDLAILSRYGMSLPGFREIVTATSWKAAGSRTILLGNINTFLSSYAGADGLKTGYTRSAGRTLAASATRNGHRLYAIVLNSNTRDEDAGRLLNWAFANLTWD